MVRVVPTGVERGVRVGRHGTGKTWSTLLRTSRLPVDWLHAVFELVRRLELPLANDGPDDRNPSDGSGEGNDNGQGCLRRRACSAIRRNGASGAGIGGSDCHELCLLTLRPGAGRSECGDIILWSLTGRKLGGSGRGGRG